MRRSYPERALHAQVAAFLRVALPEEYCWTTFPAGGGGRVRGAQLKQAGLMAGWPDIQILSPYGQTTFIGIELKAKKGRLSDEQIACHDRIRKADGEVVVCRSVEDVEETLRERGFRLKATVVSPNVYMREDDAA